MEPELYITYLKFLQYTDIPPGYTRKQIQDLKYKTRHYIVIEGLLYKTNPHDPLCPSRVLKKDEVQASFSAYTIIYSLDILDSKQLIKELLPITISLK